MLLGSRASQASLLFEKHRALCKIVKYGRPERVMRTSFDDGTETSGSQCKQKGGPLGVNASSLYWLVLVCFVGVSSCALVMARVCLFAVSSPVVFDLCGGYWHGRLQGLLLLMFRYLLLRGT